MNYFSESKVISHINLVYYLRFVNLCPFCDLQSMQMFFVVSYKNCNCMFLIKETELNLQNGRTILNKLFLSFQSVKFSRIFIAFSAFRIHVSYFHGSYY